LDRPPAGPVFSVMTHNIGSQPDLVPTTEEIAEVIRRNVVPDVLLIQEAPWKVKMKDLAGLLGFDHYVTGREMSPMSNLAILSDWPLTNPETLRFPSTYMKPTALCAEAEIDGNKVLFCTMHLETLNPQLGGLQAAGDERPAAIFQIVKDEFLNETNHSRHVKQFLDWIGPKKFDEIIIGGDFNTFPLSKPIRLMTNHFKDALWPSLDYFRGTYLRFNLPLPIKPRIDFLFHSNGLYPIEARIVRESAGDHYPIQTNFILASPEKP